MLVLSIAIAPATADATGTLKGRITHRGEAPAPKKITPTTDEAICGQQDLVEESLVVDGKTHGIKDVVVWVEKTKAPAPKTEAVLDNWRCRYEPHVLVVGPSGQVTIRNRDRFLHTSLARDDKGKQIFNVALPQKDQETKKTFAKPGVYSLACEVHSWMKGWAFVTNGELSAVTDPSGAFEILGVPGGKHTLHLWHETLGEKTLDVEVKEGQPVQVTVEWSKG
jgi:plastocyanin